MQSNVLVSTQEMSKDRWLEYRKQGIGGSDVAAVCGLSKWKSPMALWMEKTGQVEPDPAGEAAYWGTIMEPIIRDEFTARTGFPVNEVKAILQHRRFDFMQANLDGTVIYPERGEGIFEAKTAGTYSAAEWENGIPDAYSLQVQHYMAVTGLNFACVAVLIGGSKFLWRLIERDEAVIDLIIQIESRFWQLVEQKIPPEIDGSKASVELLNRLYPDSQKASIELPQEALELITQYEAAQAEEKRITEVKDLAANKLKAMLESNETGQIGGRLVGWKNVKGERFDSKALKVEHPDLYSQYLRESSYRRFVVK